ncbi:MAG: DUF1743 domain-containing protein, partial [Candidatus Nanoarchaeia archaeon]
AFDYPSPFDKKNRKVFFAMPPFTTQFNKRTPELYEKMRHFIFDIAKKVRGNIGVFCASYGILKEIIKILNESKAFYKGYKNKRGLIGATASVSWIPKKDKTYELITYRKKEKWGKKRFVDNDSTKKMDKTKHEIWLQKRRETYTTICIKKDTVEKIKKYQITPQESYDEIINRLISQTTSSFTTSPPT